jgi:hypothetical protein
MFLVVWWSIALLLAFFQGWVMTQAWWVLALVPIATALAIWGLLSWRRAFLRNQRWARRAFVTYCWLHGVPLALQFANLIPARAGNPLFAAVGLGLYLVTTVSRPRWFRTWIL